MLLLLSSLIYTNLVMDCNSSDMKHKLFSIPNYIVRRLPFLRSSLLATVGAPRFFTRYANKNFAKK